MSQTIANSFWYFIMLYIIFSFLKVKSQPLSINAITFIMRTNVANCPQVNLDNVGSLRRTFDGPHSATSCVAGFIISVINCHSLQNKLPLLSLFIEKHNCDILFLNETWLTTTTSCAFFQTLDFRSTENIDQII